MAKRQETVLQEPAPVLLDHLAQLAAADQRDDRARGRAGGAGCAMAFGALVGFFFLLPVLGAMSPALGILGALASLGLLVGAILSWIRWHRLTAADLDNERLQIARDFLGLLAQDLSQKSPVSLTLRHGDSVQFGTKSNERREGGIFAGVNHSEHEDAWLSVGGRLQDGSVFRLSVTRFIKRKAKPKRKYTKTNDRIRDEIRLALRVPADHYPHLERLQAALPADRLTQHAMMSLTSFRQEAATVRVEATTLPWGQISLRSGSRQLNAEHRLNGTRLASLMAFLYAGLSRCRDEAPPAAS